MSFSSEQKSAIIEKSSKSQCCRRAMLQGALFAKGYTDADVIRLSVEKRESCDFIAKLVKEFYGKESEIRRAKDGGRRYILSFSSHSASEYISQIENGGKLFTQKCESCQAAFLKGVFLLSARANDSLKNCSIHFSLGERSDRFAEYLSELEIAPLVFDSKGGRVLYYRSSENIESFYGYAGMNNVMFALLDARLLRNMRNNTNRHTRCELYNIEKTVDAAGKQLAVIDALEKANLLSSLPDDLEATARLRLEHRDMSLSQLSAITTPRISKPGLSHRFKRIMEIGERLLHTK